MTLNITTREAAHRPLEPVPEEHIAFLQEALEAGSATFDISLNVPFQPPSDHLLERWREESLDAALPEIAYIDECADDATKAGCDFSTYYSYLNRPYHARRARMVADLVAEAVQDIADSGEQARIVEVGPGPFVIPSLLAREEKLTDFEYVAVDEDEPLMKFGLAKGLIAGFEILRVDDERSAEALASIIRDVGAHVVVMSEVIEHIPHVAQTVAPTLGRSLLEQGARFVGSVPNAVPFSAIANLLTGANAPRELSNPIFNTKYDHMSHFTFASLFAFLEKIGFPTEGIMIASPGVVYRHGWADADYEAGLTHPHLGHSLVFEASV